VLSFKDEVFPINLPKLVNPCETSSHFVIWKINVKEVLSKDCFVKFIITEGNDVSLI